MSVCFGIQRTTLCRCCFISSLSLWFSSGKVPVFFGIQRATLCRYYFISSLSLWFSSGKVSVFFDTQRACYADIISFLHFLCGSLLAKCPYSSILNALRVAISRFESQARGGRLLVVTLAEPRQRGEDSCCHRAHCLSEASLREWQQTGAAAEQGAQRVTTSSLPPSPSLHQPKYHSHHYLPAIQRSADGPTPPEQPPQSLTTGTATLSHNITTFTPSDTTPKHPPYKPLAAHKPPAAAQPGSWNSRPYKPRSTPYSAPYQ